MKIVTIVGARPQFIKAAPLSQALRRAGHTEFLIHTGQHYDSAMSQVFFDEMGIPKPDANLGVGSGGHGWQTGQMLAKIEEHLLAQRPDWTLVYGDTNSTVAGALAAVKLHIPVAHVEAGLRSFNRSMPEEHNRVITDHCADLLFCPTQTAVDNLRREGLPTLDLPQISVHWVGDTMYDAVLQFASLSRQRSTILADLGLEPKSYLLATVHRPYNTDSPQVLGGLLRTFAECGETVIFPVHPRTRARIAKYRLLEGLPIGGLKLVEPLGYLDMLALQQQARLILTDSGGIQKEAYFFAVPCLTLRPETEWVETVQAGWNCLVGNDALTIAAALHSFTPPAGLPPALFGDGQAAGQITRHLETAVAVEQNNA